MGQYSQILCYSYFRPSTWCCHQALGLLPIPPPPSSRQAHTATLATATGRVVLLMTPHERRRERDEPHPPAAAADRRPAQVRRVEIHRSTSASLHRADRAARAGGSDHTAPAGGRSPTRRPRANGQTHYTRALFSLLPSPAVVLPDPNQLHPSTPLSAATSPASPPCGGTELAE